MHAGASHQIGLLGDGFGGQELCDIGRVHLLRVIWSTSWKVMTIEMVSWGVCQEGSTTEKMPMEIVVINRFCGDHPEW